MTRTCPTCGQVVESQVTHDSTKLPSAFRAPSTRTPVRDATNELRQALTPIDALLALLADGPVDVEALADAREGMARVIAAVERLERGEH